MNCDIGVVTSTRSYGEKFYILDVFTMSHGNMKFITRNLYTVFSLLKFRLNDGFETRLNFLYPIEHEELSSIISLSETKTLFVLHICSLLKAIIPLNSKHLAVFEFVLYVREKLREDDCACYPHLLLYFEYLILKESGFGLSVGKCSFCGSSESLEFISKNTGCVVCAKCLVHDLSERVEYRRNTNENNTFRYPEILHKLDIHTDIRDIENKLCEFELDDVLEASEISWFFLRKNNLCLNNMFRSRLLDISNRDRLSSAALG
jgi:DNA repair protein RecO (recombination protein O)